MLISSVLIPFLPTRSIAELIRYIQHDHKNISLSEDFNIASL